MRWFEENASLQCAVCKNIVACDEILSDNAIAVRKADDEERDNVSN